MASGTKYKGERQCYDKNCSLVFKTEKGALIHINEEHDGRILCHREGCGKILKARSIRMHTRYCRGITLKNTTMHKCYVKNCPSVFKTNKDRGLHINEKHGGQIACPHENCGSILKASSIFLHMKCLHGDAPKNTACERCGKVIRRGSYRNHLIACTSDGIKKFPCTFEGCKSEFTLELYLERHIRFTHLESKVKCPYKTCDVMLKPRCINTHVKNVHGNFKRACEHCGKKFSNIHNHQNGCKSNGAKHLKCSHQGCSATFSTKRNVQQHVLYVHSPPIECSNENCHAILKPYSVYSHLKVCGGVKRFKCKDCDCAYVTERLLKIHLRDAHDKEKMICQNCGRRITNMLFHRESCYDESAKKFHCTVKDCPAMFMSKEFIKYHCRRVHEQAKKCPIKGCKKYVKYLNLISHMKSRHGLRDGTPCGNCGKMLLVQNFRKHIVMCSEKNVEKNP